MEVAMATKRWTDFVEYVTNKILYEVARAFCVWWSLVSPRNRN